mmetsp:Transcript_29911/g.76106  ORF Transcript_29911/g.76106 Transcript_29911/m.76106 type:complete len:275 (-) Transcript_29911:1199-2023(-)
MGQALPIRGQHRQASAPYPLAQPPWVLHMVFHRHQRHGRVDPEQQYWRGRHQRGVRVPVPGVLLLVDHLHGVRGQPAPAHADRGARLRDPVHPLRPHHWELADFSAGSHAHGPADAQPGGHQEGRGAVGVSLSPPGEPDARPEDPRRGHPQAAERRRHRRGPGHGAAHALLGHALRALALHPRQDHEGVRPVQRPRRHRHLLRQGGLLQRAVNRLARRWHRNLQPDHDRGGGDAAEHGRHRVLADEAAGEGGGGGGGVSAGRGHGRLAGAGAAR